MKITYKAFHMVAEWKWDLPPGHDDTCGICRVEFEGTCSKCRYPGEDCPIMIGECTHCFHMHCIADWLQSDASQGRCPMCRQVFRQKTAVTATATPATPANQQNRPSSSTSTNAQGQRRPTTGAGTGTGTGGSGANRHARTAR